MSAEVETMVANGAVWHGLGVQVDYDMTAEECHKTAGLDWEVEKYPMEVRLGAGTPMQENVVVPDRHAIMRMTDHSILGTVGNRYEVIQNLDCFNFADAIVGEGQAMYHTAGSLFNGKVIFMTMKFPNDVTVGADAIEKYLLLTNAHDGSSALHVRMTPVRVVCANTLGMALGEDTKQKCSIRHTTNWETKATNARELLKLTDHYFKNMSVQFNRLLDASMNDNDIELFVESVFPRTVSEKTGELILSKQTQAIRAKVTDLAYTGKGNAAVKNTKWAALNGVSEYIDHIATTRATGGHDPQEIRMNSVLMGTGAEVKQRAYDILVEA